MTYSVNQLFNDGGVFRTAPATPGLFIYFTRDLDDLCNYFGG